MKAFNPKDIVFTTELNSLVDYIDGKNYSYIYLLVDENTNQHCLPIIANLLSNEIRTYSILEVPAGEDSKDLEICGSLWASLTEEAADRNAIFINLGGGMICDLGGFVASCYKRGISFINIPTSYLAMVDAAIGGKCGIDFMGYKNQLGAFALADKTFIYPNFLETLPEIEMLSGFAESLKHGLIANAELWKHLELEHVSLKSIEDSIKVKVEIVAKDPLEKGERKKLNFGHTIGHAIESYYLEKGELAPHGFCVIAGIICESYISMQLNLISAEEFDEIESKIDKTYNRLQLQKEIIPVLIQKMGNDKKNENGEINFTLLKGIGNSVINQNVSEELIEESITNYIS